MNFVFEGVYKHLFYVLLLLLFGILDLHEVGEHLGKVVRFMRWVNFCDKISIKIGKHHINWQLVQFLIVIDRTIGVEYGYGEFWVLMPHDKTGKHQNRGSCLVGVSPIKLGSVGSA